MSDPAAYDLPFPIHERNPSVPVQDNGWWAGLVNKLDGEKLWPVNKTFRIAFLNGTANQKAKVKKYAQAWVRAIGAVQFDWVNGIHGDVRIAFSDPKDAGANGDPIQQISWSQVGTDCVGRNYLPETTHLNEITDTDPNIKPTTDEGRKTVRYERIIVEHEFGHILGFQFAPNSSVELGKKSLKDWRTAVNWTAIVDGQKANIEKYLKDSYGDEKPSVNASQVWAKNLGDPIMEPGLIPDSVMVFDWRNRISANDANVMAHLYPFQIRAITFGIQDAFDRSLKGLKDDDLVLYAIGVNNYIYRNTRYIWKGNATSRAESAWNGWERLGVAPRYARSFVALDFPDRLEFFVAANSKDDPTADESLLLHHNALKKETNVWSDWKAVKHVNAELKLLHTKTGRKEAKVPLELEPATILRAVEVDGGANVFFITDKNVLGTIFRKAGEPEVPKSYHPVSGGSDVIAITSARIGAPTITNPPRIVAVIESSNKFDISISTPNKSMQNWSLNSEGTAHDPDLKILRLATGMAIDTQHIIGIGADGKLHQNHNKDGWLSWDDVFNQMKADKGMPIENGTEATFVSISVGVIASNDQEDGYLRGFAVSSSGKLWVSRVDDEGNWSKWSDDIGIPKDKPLKGIKRVTAKRTRSGDLVVFVISKEYNDRRKAEFEELYSITYNKDGLSDASKKFGFQKVWWDPRNLEALEAKK